MKTLVCSISTLLLLVVSGCADTDPTPSPDISGVVVLSAIDDFPCELELVPTGVAIRAIADGSAPDPSIPITIGPSGKYYGGVGGFGAATSIAVWSPDGDYLYSIGRRGEGPGEFIGMSRPVVLVDSSETLHAFDGPGGRYQKFSQDGRFLSFIALPDVVFQSQSFLMLGDDTVLVRSNRGTGSQFQVFTSSSGEIRGFGEAQVGLGDEVFRSIASSDDSTFWVAPVNASPGGYVLEQWSVSGRLLRTIIRDVPWLPTAQPAGVVDQVWQEAAPAYRVYLGANGHIVVSVWAEAEEWLEVIDPASSTVLASSRIRSTPVPQLWQFHNVFPGTRVGITPEADELDLRSLVMMEYRLVHGSADADPRDPCWATNASSRLISSQR